jgi:hypothetical protein
MTRRWAGEREGSGPASLARPPASFAFEYLGSTTMTVLGSVSGRHYRFVGHGARLLFAAVPRLREVRFS